jgi:sulfide:quinone oxidoreductase
MSTRQEPARITVLGVGFGALSTVRELRRLDANARITLVAPRAELHYLPGIIWIPSGLRSRTNLLVPLDNFLRRMAVDFHPAEVTGLADGGRTVHTTQGDVANG